MSRRRSVDPVAVLVAVAVAVGVLAGPTAARARTAGTPTPSDQRSTTALAMQRLLNDFVVPSTAVVTDPPPKGLTDPFEQPVSPHYVDSGRAWVVPATPDDVLAYVRDHRPDGLAPRGSGTAIQGGKVVLRAETFDLGGRWDKPRLYAEGEAQVQVKPLDNGTRTGLRIDAGAVWVAARDPRQTIPKTVTRVDLVVQRGDSAREVHRGFRSATARRLARLVNALTVTPDGSTSCGSGYAGRGHYRDLLSFEGPGTRRTVAVPVSGCSYGHITIRRGRERLGPALTGDLDGPVLATLHLPKDYGYPPSTAP